MRRGPVSLRRIDLMRCRALAIIHFRAPAPSLGHPFPHLGILGSVREFGHRLAFRGEFHEFLRRIHRQTSRVCPISDNKAHLPKMFQKSSWDPRVVLWNRLCFVFRMVCAGHAAFLTPLALEGSENSQLHVICYHNINILQESRAAIQRTGLQGSNIKTVQISAISARRSR